MKTRRSIKLPPIAKDMHMNVKTASGVGHLPAGEILWAALLAVAAIGGSLVFACITPFAAFAVIAAETQRSRGAFGTMALIWAANQAVGYALLGYPFDGHATLWGAAIGVAALLAAAMASLVVARMAAAPRWARLAVAFAAAFAAYESLLLALGIATGELATFAPGVVGDLALLDAAWLAGLAVVQAGLSRLGWPAVGFRRPA